MGIPMRILSKSINSNIKGEANYEPTIINHAAEVMKFKVSPVGVI